MEPEAEPTDEELAAFVGAMLSNLDQLLREPALIEEAVRDQREMWVLLFRASQSFGAAGS